jgi:Ca2+-binding EF-hand superfamily protein
LVCLPFLSSHALIWARKIVVRSIAGARCADKLQKAFEKVDADGSGAISSNEWCRWIMSDAQHRAEINMMRSTTGSVRDI